MNLRSTDNTTPAPWGSLAAGWGLLGISLLLGTAIARLSLVAADAFSYPWSSAQYALFVGFTLFMAYSEGYKGFQKAFSPRVAARARHLAQSPHPPARVWLAPLFCMGFFGATRRRQTVTWCLTLGIIGLILVVRLLPQPWRGIIDFGVVIGLTWGLVSLWIYTWLAFTRPHFAHNPELPAPAQS